MKSNQPLSQLWSARPTLHPRLAKFLRRCDAVAQFVGVSAIVVGHGLRHSGLTSSEFGAVVMLAMAMIATGILFRYRWSLAKPTFWKRYLPTTIAVSAWGIGLVLVLIFGPLLPDTNGRGLGGSRWWGMVHLSEIVLGAYALFGLIYGIRRLASHGVQPAILLVGSFLFLISVGTVVLMLPVSRNLLIDRGGEETPASTPFEVALFTATSASCVTGLVVVDTATYWSRFGQIVIMCLFQVGGLGIMTFGAFFAMIAGRNIRLSEFATMRELLSSGNVGNFRTLVYSVIGMTLGFELVGAILLIPLWSHLPLGECAFQCLFHAVSAFCNAGFSLNPNSFVGMADSWCVSGVICGLIILGGIGFSVTYNLLAVSRSWLKRKRFHGIHRPLEKPVRMRLDTKLVVVTTTVLLFGGCLVIFLLERVGVEPDRAMRLSDAWFQSVTFRTAGFNTVDLGELQTSTKLIAILLMTIGASPGSTGGGIKTLVFAVAVVGLIAILRGRDRVEAFGRTLSPVAMNRALAIVFVSLSIMLFSTLLLVIFERRPELFLDHLFESASAVGTTGASTTIFDSSGDPISTTRSLSRPSRLVIVVAMLLGRIGPLSILLALSREEQTLRYDYPTERLTLG